MPTPGTPPPEPDRVRSARRRFLGLGLATVAAVPLGLAACGDGAVADRDEPRTGDDVSTARAAGRPERIAYGEGDSRFGDLWLPEGEGPHPAVVLIHGGFWRDQYDLTLMDALAADVVARGWVAWNIEYRRVGEDGGGWPGTLQDVADAFDHLALLSNDPSSPIDATRVAVAGHSAGGHLAAWIGTRPGLPERAPGASPELVPVAVVSQAGVVDLRQAVADGLGGSATEAFLGAAPDAEPDRYALASPIERLPTGIPTRCVHGRADDLVPFTQSEAFVAAAREAGDLAVLAPFDGDHFPVLDPTHESWVDTVAWLDPYLHP